MTDLKHRVHSLPKPSALISPTAIQGNEYKNVLLIDKSVQEYQQFIDSANTDTFPIVYSVMSSKTDLLALLKTNFTSISRLGLVFHSSSSGNSITFLDREPLFVADEVNANQQFIKDVINEFQIKNIDYLACNTLNFPNWVNYYNAIAKDTGVIIGASNDKTGNIKYGGDWILESTNENVELIYFTQSIEYYKYLLSTFIFDNIIYITNNDNTSCYVIGYTNDLSGAITIPSTVTDFIHDAAGVVTYSYNVTSIGVNAFIFCLSLISVNMPNVTSIGVNAFNYCPSLSSVSMPLVTSIGDKAFYNCGNLLRSSIQIPQTLQLNAYRFYIDYRTTLTIPSHVTSIDDFMFAECSVLTSIDMPSVTNISEGAFIASGLTGVSMPLVESIGTGAFYNCSGLTGVSMPLVESIGYLAFFNCASLNSVSMPLVTSIGDQAFYNCSTLMPGSISIPAALQPNSYRFYIDPTNGIVTIPNDVTSIEPWLFAYCTILTSIIISTSVTSIGNNTFSYSNLESVTFPSGVTTIENEAFKDCSNLESVIFIDQRNLISIGRDIFYNAPITSVTYYNTSGVGDLGAASQQIQTQLRLLSSAYTYIPHSFPPSLPSPPTISSVSPETSNILETAILTITGTNFISGNTTVSIGGLYAENIIVNGSGNIITCTSPIQYRTGYVSIVVTTPGGSSTLSNTYYLEGTETLGTVNATMTFGGVNYDPTLASDITNNTEFVGILASFLDINPSQITITSVTQGSIIVSYIITGVTEQEQTILNNITQTNLDTSTIINYIAEKTGVDVTLINITSTVEEFIEEFNPPKIVSNICFPSGTPITCNQGTVSIEQLNPEIHTIRGKKIVGITKTVTQDKYLVCFEKDALQENIPSQKTIISKNHGIFYKGEMMQAKDFINDFANVKKVKYTGEVLYNVLMEQPDKMMVNNLICETLHPENTVAKLYKALIHLNAEEQNEVISKFNQCVIENNVYKKAKSKKNI